MKKKIIMQVNKYKFSISLIFIILVLILFSIYNIYNIKEKYNYDKIYYAEGGLLK